MKKLIHILRFFLPPLLWAMVIFAFSSYPTGNASAINWQDFILKKTAHMVEYAVFTTLLYRAFINTGVKPQRAIVYSVLIAILYGITDEIHQGYTPGRKPHARDVIFDTIGALLAAVLIQRWLPIAPKKLRQLATSYHLI